MEGRAEIISFIQDAFFCHILVELLNSLSYLEANVFILLLLTQLSVSVLSV